MYLCDMKLYSVFTLFVIQKDNKKFICKKWGEENTFVEFFTKEKFVVADESELELLCNYYSPLEVANYKSMEPLMLSKKDILRAYIWLNDKELDKKNNKDSYVEIWQDYVERKKDTQDMPIINVKELIK